VLHVSRWKCRIQKIAKNSPSGHHRTTLSGYIFAIKSCIDNRKKLLNSNISSTSPHNMVNFGPLGAEIVLLVWGTPANFNGLRVLVLLLQRRPSTEANQTLHDVWPAVSWAGTLYIHVLEFLPHYGILPGATFTLRPSLALFYFGSVTARHSSSGRQPNFAALKRGRHLYSAGRPSRWASAHILVSILF